MKSMQNGFHTILTDLEGVIFDFACGFHEYENNCVVNVSRGASVGFYAVQSMPAGRDHEIDNFC